MPPPFAHVGIHFSLFDTVKPSKQTLNRYFVTSASLPDPLKIMRRCDSSSQTGNRWTTVA
jgi:hypothetical protein